VRAGFVVPWLRLDVSGFRSVLARGWHDQLGHWLHNAKLDDAELSGAKLTGSGITDEQRAAAAGSDDGS
jgi:hypothetical protein